MGGVQEKVRDAYSTIELPMIKNNYRYGCAPGQSSQKKIHSETSIKMPSNQKLGKKYSNDTADEEGEEVQSQSYPYSAIGIVRYQEGRHIREGTGFLISRNVVMTCARNLYSHRTRQLTSQVTFILGGRKVKAHKVHIPDLFKQENQHVNRYDFGLIQLGDKIDLCKERGYLGLNFREVVSQENQHSYIGFAKGKVEGTFRLFEGLLVQTQKQPSIMNYQSNMILKTGGAPILHQTQGQLFVIGIHSGSRDYYNGCGVRFNQKTLAQINQWLKVEEQIVNLKDKKVGKAGIKELIKLGNLVHVVYLAKNQLGPKGLKHFPRVDWNRLYSLDLGGNNLKKEGVDLLIEASIPNLKVLNLWGNQLGKQGVKSLLLSKWPLLQSLNLYNNELTDEGLALLVKKAWNKLNTLNIGRNKLERKAIDVLKSSSWHTLVCLNIWGNLIPENKIVRKELNGHFPKLNFLYI